MTLGQKIRKFRLAKGWTQKRLEKESGVENRNLTRYEHDKVRPRPKILKQIAAALEVSVDELLAEEGEQTEQMFQDKELLNQFLAVQHMGNEDREAIKRIIRAMIIKDRVRDLQAV